MKQISLTTVAIAASTFTCAALLSFGWSERGLSLSVEKAEARVGRPLTPVSVAGVARRQNRRAVYGAGYGVGAGAAAVGTAAAIGTAGAIAATSPNWGWGGNPYQTDAGYYAGGPYYGGGIRAANAAYYGGGPNNRGGLVGGDDSGTYAAAPYGGPVRAANAAFTGGYPSAAGISTTPHYAVKAYYAGGPWYNYSGWDDYRARNGIACTPGTLTKLDDGHMYVCQ